MPAMPQHSPIHTTFVAGDDDSNDDVPDLMDPDDSDIYDDMPDLELHQGNLEVPVAPAA